jgi:hypothetical protein
MLVDHHQTVETNGKSGRDGHAEGERSNHNRNGGNPGSALPQLQPVEIPFRAARHHQGDQSEQEGQRDRVAGVQEVDPLGAARHLDRSRKRQEAGEADDQRRPVPASTA